jgi:putative SOS response-associated peptidase YedK
LEQDSREHSAGDVSEQTTKLEQELFKQRTRLIKVERSLETKVTNVASEDKRIATNKIENALCGLEDINRTDLKRRDSRIFSESNAPLVVMEDGKYVVKPMRYKCRMAGKPANYNVKYPGTYNARFDNSQGFWKPCFGVTHGIMLADVFYENVKRATNENTLLETHEREENVVLEFRPGNGQLIHVACLWSHWSAPGQPDLLSFAAITDELPPEVEAAGHDRCIIPVKPENVAAWLNPASADFDAMYAILEDRDRPLQPRYPRGPHRAAHRMDAAILS